MWKHRRRGLLAIVGTVLALTGLAIALVPPPSSQAATGRKWSEGVQHAGVLTTNTMQCSVTVISEWLAITAKHCGRVNAVLQLDVSTTSNPGVVGIKNIEVNRDLDLEALILQKGTGLTVTPHEASINQFGLTVWGYGWDRSNNKTNWLTRADFDRPYPCPSHLSSENGNLCFPTTTTNSLCYGDSGAPVIQNGAIIGMLVAVAPYEPRLPNGLFDCGRVELGQAISVKQMQTWLDQMIKDADPFN